jgi:hypothetical protein
MQMPIEMAVSVDRSLLRVALRNVYLRNRMGTESAPSIAASNADEYPLGAFLASCEGSGCRGRSYAYFPLLEVGDKMNT